MIFSKLSCVLFFIILAISNCVEISVAKDHISLAQKRKVYCLMISYHFLDNDMQRFRALTQGFSALRIEVFKNKVAYRLAQNCQQKISIQQLMELTRLVDHPQGHEQEIQTLQHKYIQYFAPQKDIVIHLLNNVKLESELEIQKQVQKFHQQRKHIEEQTQVFVQGFKALETHISQTHHHLFSTLKQFYEVMYDFHDDLTQNVNKLKVGYNQTVENLKGNFSQGVQKIKSHPHVKMAKDFWDGLWDQL